MIAGSSLFITLCISFSGANAVLHDEHVARGTVVPDHDCMTRFESESSNTIAFVGHTFAQAVQPRQSGLCS